MRFLIEGIYQNGEHASALVGTTNVATHQNDLVIVKRT